LGRNQILFLGWLQVFQDSFIDHIQLGIAFFELPEGSKNFGPFSGASWAGGGSSKTAGARASARA
jgi:hypothetical protein